MSALTSTGLVSPQAVSYSMESLCRQQDEQEQKTSSPGRTCSADGPASPAAVQNGDYESLTSGDKQDELSANEDQNNYENLLDRDFDDELTETDDDEMVIGHHASLDVTMATESTETSASILMSSEKPKRNKRKNFKPRNISYAEDEPQFDDNHPQSDRRNNCDSDLEMDIDDDSRELDRFHKPLDLSDSTTLPSAPKRRRKPATAPQRRVAHGTPSGGGGGGGNGGGGGGGAAPMDLSCSRSSLGNDEACAADDESESADEYSESGTESRLFRIQNSESDEFPRNYHENNNGFVYTGVHRQPRHSHQRQQGNQGHQGQPSQHPGDRFATSASASASAATVAAASAAAAAMFNTRGGFPRFLCPEQLSAYHHMPGTDASAMKEYAENTMKELLSIYGLSGGDMAENITKNVPMANFSSGKILETLSPKHLPGHPLRVRPPRSPQSPSSQPPSPPHTPLTPPTRSAHSPRLGQHNTHTLNSSDPQAAVYEQIRHKMAKLVGLPSNPMAANQRVVLPQNMATILTLAAMQEQQNKPGGSNPHPLQGRALGTTSPTSGLVILDPSKSGGLLGHRMSPMSPVRDGASNGKSPVPIDYSRYVKRFGSALDCASSYCKDLNYREHFHCLDCNSRVFVKKEEMIRHFKWHKKRDESLQHGFMRYSPMDDCSEKYSDCTHNRKQTHYHCIKDGCDKVYISTSDVQMHANYHRKDSAIIQEGFQRFRATEECGASYCSFFGQRTTHFHCRRDNCRYTFKNKADMEKHKSYHIKDEQLNRDGFKKFMKQEACPFESCRFSRVCNHIHCIRAGCSYVLHSSGQLFSHKRKHERQDSELAYRKFKLAQSMMKTFSGGETSNASMLQAFNDQLSQHSDLSSLQQGRSGMDSQTLSNGDSSSDGGGRSSPLPQSNMEGLSLSQSQSEMNVDPWEDLWPKYLARIGPEDRCPNCEFVGLEHFHCLVDACSVSFRCMDGVREHARSHEQQDHLSESFYTSDCETDCPYYQSKERHYHCTWDNCREVILTTDKPFRRLDHYKMHEYSRKLSLTKDPLTSTHLATSIDGMFRRKRGRPPKNRVIEFPSAPGSLMDSPQAIFTSFKLPKPSATSTSPSIAGSPTMLTCQPDMLGNMSSPPSPDGSSKSSTPHRFDILQEGFYAFGEGAPCPDALCAYARTQHFHCSQQRCFYATEREDLLLMHAKDFHDNIDILDGFLFFDRAVDCRLPSCHSNKVNRHFHCMRPNCGYSFVRYSTMAVHEQKHKTDAIDGNGHYTKSELNSPIHIKTEPNQESNVPSQNSPTSPTNRPNHSNASSPDASSKTTVVKASGTFYPLSAFSCGPAVYGGGAHAHGGPGVKGVPKSSPRGSSPLALTPSQPLSPLIADKPSLGSQEYKSNVPQLAESPRPDWMLPERHVRYGPDQSCCRPFCKLKRKEHYHCNACNQAFSDVDRLKPHIAKHSSGALSPQPVTYKREPEDNNNEETNDSAGGLSSHYDAPPTMLDATPQLLAHPGIYPPHSLAFNTPFGQPFLITSQSMGGFMPPGMPAIYSAPGGGLMFGPPMHHPMVNGGLDHPSEKGSRSPQPPVMMDMSPEAKKARVQNSMRILKDEPVPEGYVRYRFNEDCKYAHCGYREHQTHFHCMRPDCGYSFCDKTRFVQHTARHERLDTLMGGDFQQFRANVPCGRADCVYTSTLGAMQNKASHFHCLKCEFVCTDTNKVVAHRRQHQKLDSIMAAGFEKFTPSQPCALDACAHSGKQTHYHCLSCQYAVLGLSQMSAHKYRHME